MDQVNVIIELNPRRLEQRLATMNARVGHSVVAAVIGVPDDCTAPYLRVFTEHGEYYDAPLNYHRESRRHSVYIVGMCFPKVGRYRYEVHAIDCMGNRTALGEGALEIEPFSVTSSPAETGAPVMVTRMPTDQGGYVDIQYVWDGFDWVAKAILED